ncbi:hypothetical protein L6R50_24445 [Myxococcota bacterium]|nr:hypothetical protein [Myxococcota bacterium]
MIALACVVWGLVLSLVGSALLPSLGFGGPGPDLLLPLVVFLGFARPLAPGLAACLALGVIADSFAGAGAGVHLFAYATAFTACRLAAARLILRGAMLAAALTAGASLLGEQALSAWASLGAFPLPSPSGGVLWRAAVDGAFAPLVLWPAYGIARIVQGRREPWTLSRTS